MPQLDVNTFLPQVVWLVITFTALFLLMWRVAVPCILCESARRDALTPLGAPSIIIKW